MFENVANNLSWPKTSQSTLLQTVLSGKAHIAYTALSSDRCTDYEVVKDVVLKAYELTPEA